MKITTNLPYKISLRHKEYNKKHPYMGGYLVLPSAIMLVIGFFPHSQFCLFAQYSHAILNRASQISVC